ncbi:hypothetical protein Ddye_028624, partial [Dipteronia dyeriana]
FSAYCIDIDQMLSAITFWKDSGQTVLYADSAVIKAFKNFSYTIWVVRRTILQRIIT